MKFVSEYSEPINVETAFEVQRFAYLRDLMAVVKMLDSLFESDGNEKSDDECCTMDEEVVPGVNSPNGGVYGEHGRRNRRVAEWFRNRLHRSPWTIGASLSSEWFGVICHSSALGHNPQSLPQN
jgi:hypothetical protein